MTRLEEKRLSPDWKSAGISLVAGAAISVIMLTSRPAVPLASAALLGVAFYLYGQKTE